MAKYAKGHSKPSIETQQEAMKIAKGTQKPGQTKEQTKLIAQGIQKGIELYKKQQKAKARELDKKLKSAGRVREQSSIEPEMIEVVTIKQNWLPWCLLAASWCFFAIFSYLELF